MTSMPFFGEIFPGQDHHVGGYATCELSGDCLRRHRAVADSLEEAGDRLFTFTRLPPTQWRSARTTNAIERLHEEFKRGIKTPTVLPSADTAAMLF
jgi:transposase-like protein